MQTPDLKHILITKKFLCIIILNHFIFAAGLTMSRTDRNQTKINTHTCAI